MSTASQSRAVSARNWRALSVLHERVAARVERRLRAEHGLSAREFSLLNVLSRQKDGHLQMREVAEAVVLSQSATTRLVTRLEDRGLLERTICVDDRRGIYTDVTASGAALLEAAGATNDTAIREALDEASADPQFEPLVEALERMRL